MFQLKGCPRCKGDLREDKDQYGRFVICVQCGHHESETKDISPPILPLVSRRGRPRKNAAEPSLT